ncbi:MAG TPA: acyltransferase family protein [Thiobacillus sp.]
MVRITRNTTQNHASVAHRYTHIDTMKAIGIVLVVLGHAPGLNDFAKNVIYSFHMPLFFFVSGLLLTGPKVSLPFKHYFLQAWHALGVPYLFFFLISYLYWLPTHDLSSRADQYSDMAWWAPLSGVLIGNGEALFVNVVLWFFTSLLVTALIFHLARKYFSAGLLLLCFNLGALLFAFAREPSWPRLPWGLDNAIVALGFYSAGHYLHSYQPGILARISCKTAILIAAISMAGLIYGAFLNGEVDLNTLIFGHHPTLYSINAYLGILALFCLAIQLPGHATTRWLSQNSIIIFPLHLLMFSLFTGIGVVVFDLPHTFKSSAIEWTIAFTVLALLLSYPSAWILKRCAPAVFLKRSKPPAPDTKLESNQPVLKT